MIGGFPLYLSKPHFLDADPAVQAAVSGLHPSNASHLNYIDVEPITGVTFDTHKRVQLNVRLDDHHFPGRTREAVSAFLLLLNRKAGGGLLSCMRGKVDWRFPGGAIYMPMVRVGGTRQAKSPTCGEGGVGRRCMMMTVWRVWLLVVLPQVWYDEGFSQPVSMTSDFKTQVYGSQKAARLYRVLGLVLGSLAIVAAVVGMWAVRRKEKREEAQGEGQGYAAMRGRGSVEEKDATEDHGGLQHGMLLALDDDDDEEAGRAAT